MGDPNDLDDPQGRRFWSFHPGGSNFLFVDGSVRFIKYSIARDVLSRLATRNGGCPVTNTDRPWDSRRHFLRGLAGVAVGVNLAAAGGCGSNPPPVKKAPAATKRLPPRPPPKRG